MNCLDSSMSSSTGTSGCVLYGYRHNTMTMAIMSSWAVLDETLKSLSVNPPVIFVYLITTKVMKSWKTMIVLSLNLLTRLCTHWSHNLVC